jgi:hypothetical protein
VVRLGHLFEGFAFKQQFRAALCQVITDNFVYQSCAELPRKSGEWSRKRFCTVPNLSRDRNYHKNSIGFRLKVHMKLRIHDNGDPSSQQWFHWCLGDCCEGESRPDKEIFCLASICESYCLLYGNGYNAPLTYRWKGADEAQEYLSETQQA